MHSDAPYFIILLSLMPDDFTHQGESAATQRQGVIDPVNIYKKHLVNINYPKPSILLLNNLK